MHMFRQKRSRTVENVCREYSYRSNRKFPQLCLLFHRFFFNQRFFAVIIFIFAERFPSHATPTPLPLNSEEHKNSTKFRGTLEK